MQCMVMVSAPRAPTTRTVTKEEPPSDPHSTYPNLDFLADIPTETSKVRSQDSSACPDPSTDCLAVPVSNLPTTKHQDYVVKEWLQPKLSLCGSTHGIVRRRRILKEEDMFLSCYSIVSMQLHTKKYLSLAKQRRHEVWGKVQELSQRSI